MSKQKRSYYLPEKLIKVFDEDCKAYGTVREKVVAAALVEFLRSDADTRAQMFDRLDRALRGKKR